MIRIGILGCGTVASGVIKLLAMHGESVRVQLGEEVEVAKVLARTPAKALALGLTEAQICSDFGEILNDPTISVVIELIGGTDAAYTYISEALKAGKHVVTANKDLIATHFQELNDLAAAHSVRFAFEASVGGGIPLVDSIRRTLAANRIQSMFGILNGTTNYILTKMTQNGLSYAEALAEAQRLGFAEANPASDVGGGDAARKIAILSTLAFHSPVSYYDVYHEGIAGITPTDIRFADQSGFVFKLLGIARQHENACEAYVRPALVPKRHPLASVSDSFNAVFITGDAVGEVMLYGRGAGSLPTASSVVGDLMNVVRAGRGHTAAALSCYENLPVMDILDSENVYYVRLSVQDRPMVLARVAGVFGKHGVSLASLVQESRGKDSAELLLFTHRASERELSAAMADLRNLDAVHEGAYWICMEDDA
ncbi:MAG: homoserine dehydrogenase [Clostridia bacterium]|nr:homoserine dehydrogenase [Clostridia bacterium]